MTIETTHKNSIILFDGDCNFCNSSVNFIIARDKKKTFHFARLESKIGKQLLEKFNVPVSKYGSIVLVKNDSTYLKSSAGLRIAQNLSGLYPCLIVFLVVPKFIRDWVYDLIAKNRHRIKSDRCIIPDTTIRERFIES